MYPYGFQENFIVRLELNSSEKVILCNRGAAATTAALRHCLEHDSTLDACYAVPCDVKRASNDKIWTKRRCTFRY